jgi:hypothetical protein
MITGRLSALVADGVVVVVIVSLGVGLLVLVALQAVAT